MTLITAQVPLWIAIMLKIPYHLLICWVLLCWLSWHFQYWVSNFLTVVVSLGILSDVKLNVIITNVMWLKRGWKIGCDWQINYFVSYIGYTSVLLIDSLLNRLNIRPVLWMLVLLVAAAKILAVKASATIDQKPVCWTKSSCLAQALGVTKFISSSYMILVTLCCAT